MESAGICTKDTGTRHLKPQLHLALSDASSRSADGRWVSAQLDRAGCRSRSDTWSQGFARHGCHSLPVGDGEDVGHDGVAARGEELEQSRMVCTW